MTRGRGELSLRCIRLRVQTPDRLRLPSPRPTLTYCASLDHDAGTHPIVVVSFRGKPTVADAVVKAYPDQGDPIELKSDKDGRINQPGVAEDYAPILLVEWIEKTPVPSTENHAPRSGTMLDADNRPIRQGAGSRQNIPARRCGSAHRHIALPCFPRPSTWLPGRAVLEQLASRNHRRPSLLDTPSYDRTTYSPTFPPSRA